MTAVAQTTRRGHKHRCGACGAAFYDLERELSACPKCNTPYEEPAHMPRGEPLRKRQSWSKAARPEPEPEPEAPAAEAREEEDDEGEPADAADDADQAEEADEGSEAAENDDA